IDLVKKHPGSCEFHSNLAYSYKNSATRISQRLSNQTSAANGTIGYAMVPRVGWLAVFLRPEAVFPLNAFNSCLRQKSLLEIRDSARLAVAELKQALEIEPKRVDYIPILHEALLDLSRAELDLRSYADVAII